MPAIFNMKNKAKEFDYLFRYMAKAPPRDEGITTALYACCFFFLLYLI
jgi:hypothetical protein